MRYRVEPCPTCGQPMKAIDGTALRDLREHAGLTQRDLAAQLGVSGPYLSDMERNRRTVPARVLAAYKALGRASGR